MTGVSHGRFFASFFQFVITRFLIQLYSAFTETGATQTMKTNQMAELKQ